MNRTTPTRILLCADTHLGFDLPVRPRVERRRRGFDFFSNFRCILDHALALKVDLVVHGGDFFFRSRLPEPIVSRAYDMLVQFADQGIPFLIVPGNHERSRLPSSLFLEHENIHIFHTPQTKVFESASGRLAFTGFPNVRSGIASAFGARLADSNWSETDGDFRFLCFHQSVEGARVGPSDFMFRRGDDVIGMDQIPDEFDAVLCGHIHRRQILPKQRANGTEMPVVYPGSIERTSFAEQKEEKGYYLIVFENGASGDRPTLRFEFIRLPARPMVDLTIRSNIDKADMEDRLRKEISGFSPDSIVRLQAAHDLAPELRALFTGEFIRRIFPATMNVQFSGGFFGNDRER